MSYIPGAGIKKPMNTLTNPIHVDIKKGPPQFRNSGKHWKVDPGRTLRELHTSGTTQHYDHAVLTQSRDYNKTRYGQSSHKDVVNKAFRPPLIRMEDTMPLSRQPRKAVVPRINPGTSHDGFQAQNTHKNNVTDHLTDRISEVVWDTGYYMPIDVPIDNSVLPDLQMKLPCHSKTAGFNTAIQFDAPVQEVTLREEKVTPLLQTYAQSGIDGQTYTMHERDLHKVKQKRPNYSVALNKETFYRERNETNVPHFKTKLQYNQGRTSGGVMPKKLDWVEHKLKPVKATKM